MPAVALAKPALALAVAALAAACVAGLRLRRSMKSRAMVRLLPKVDVAAYNAFPFRP